MQNKFTFLFLLLTLSLVGGYLCGNLPFYILMYIFIFIIVTLASFCSPIKLVY